MDKAETFLNSFTDLSNLILIFSMTYLSFIALDMGSGIVAVPPKKSHVALVTDHTSTSHKTGKCTIFSHVTKKIDAAVTGSIISHPLHSMHSDEIFPSKKPV